MLPSRSILFLLLLATAACGETEAVAPPPPPPPAASPSETLHLGSAADELVVDEQTVSSSALAALGGRGSATPTPTPTPKPTRKRAVDRGLGVDGGRSVTAGQIKRVIGHNQPQVTACYERELKGSPGLRGKVVVGFVIGADGRVRPPRIIANGTHNRALTTCIKRAVRSWRFPRAEGPADVEYPFVFKPRDF